MSFVRLRWGPAAHRRCSLRAAARRPRARRVVRDHARAELGVRGRLAAVGCRGGGAGRRPAARAVGCGLPGLDDGLLERHLVSTPVQSSSLPSVTTLPLVSHE